MDQLKEFASQILASQPFSVLIGTKVLEFGPDGVSLGLEITDQLKQQHGFVHGGVLSYLADNTLTFAGGLALQGGDILTSEFKINYLRPAIGQRLIARANAIGAGKRQAVCQCEIFAVNDGEEKLCAVAQGTIAKK